MTSVWLVTWRVARVPPLREDDVRWTERPVPCDRQAHVAPAALLPAAEPGAGSVLSFRPH